MAFQTGEMDGWRLRAKCRDVPDASTIFFPIRGADVKVPKAICAGCPVKAECLEYAVENDLLGIWGGTGRNERRRIIRARRQQHGTPAAYRHHLLAGETPCGPCQRVYDLEQESPSARPAQMDIKCQFSGCESPWFTRPLQPGRTPAFCSDTCRNAAKWQQRKAARVA